MEILTVMTAILSKRNKKIDKFKTLIIKTYFKLFSKFWVDLSRGQTPNRDNEEVFKWTQWQTITAILIYPLKREWFEKYYL